MVIHVNCARIYIRSILYHHQVAVVVQWEHTGLQIKRSSDQYCTWAWLIQKFISLAHDDAAHCNPIVQNRDLKHHWSYFLSPLLLARLDHMESGGHGSEGGGGSSPRHESAQVWGGGYIMSLQICITPECLGYILYDVGGTLFLLLWVYYVWGAGYIVCDVVRTLRMIVWGKSYMLFVIHCKWGTLCILLGGLWVWSWVYIVCLFRWVHYIGA